MEMDEKQRTAAKNIQAVVFDSLGVFFSEVVLHDKTTGEVMRTRSHADGQGISLLRSAGIRIAIITSEKEGFLEPIVTKLNNLPSVKEGRWVPIECFMGDAGKDKVATIDTWLQTSNLTWDVCAYMGDDLGDYAVMQKAGFAAAPAQAEEVIKNISHFVASRRGGDGAIRDFANFVLSEKDVDVTQLELK